jgi:signal peptide peptidase SppA
MELTDFPQGSVWSIQPEVLDGLIRRYGDTQELKGLSIGAASLLSRGSGESKPYRIQNGVAVIPVAGPIMKRETIWSLIFGGTSIEGITRSFAAALEDPEVSAVVLSIDSPGGTVSGIETLGDLIFNSSKPVVAFGNGMITSAAYWIGSAASSVIIEETAQAGSIGVLMVHYDFSEQDRQQGMKRTYLSAGKYKALGNDSEPLTREARAVFEEQLDYYYTLFVNAVARNRQADPGTVIEAMAEGRIFIGSQAVEAGLADRTGNLKEAIGAAQALVEEQNPKNKFNIAGGRSPGKEFQMSKETMFVTVEALAAAYPDFAQALREEGARSIDLEKTRMEATKTERERILGLVSIQSGEETGKKLRAIAEQGITPEAFKAVMEALGPVKGKSREDSLKAEILEGLKRSGADNPGAGHPPATQGDKDFMVLVEEYALAHKVKKTAAMKAVMKSHPEAHKAYIQKMNA